jgi:hypothetical protein
MKYSLTADSRSWWLPSAVAGAIGAVALGAILILPLAGESAPVNPAPDAPATSVPSGDGVGRTCFMQRPPRIYGVDDLPQPNCQ